MFNLKKPQSKSQCVIGDESVMSKKKHGSFDTPVQQNLPWNCDTKIRATNDLQNDLNLQEFQTVSEDDETKLDKDDFSEMDQSVAQPPLRRGVDNNYSFINRKSLVNVVKGWGALEEFMDNITNGSSLKGSSNKSNSLYSSKQKWDSGGFDDGVEELQRELAEAESNQPEAEKGLQSPSDDAETKFDDDDIGEMPPVKPPASRSLGRGYSFIRRESLLNLAKDIDDGLDNYMDDSTKVGRKGNLSQSIIWDTGATDGIFDDGMDELQREIAAAEREMAAGESYQPDDDGLEELQRELVEAESYHTSL